MYCNWLHLQASCMHPKEFNDLFLKSLTERLTTKNEGQGNGIIYDVMVDLHKFADANFAITQNCFTLHHQTW